MKRLLLAVLLVAVALVGGAALLERLPEGLVPRLSRRVVPVSLLRLERRTFVRKAIAEGYLRAVKATPITVPPDVPGAQRVAWVAENGALVRAGDVLMQLDAGEMERNLADGQSERRIAEAKIAGATARTEAQKSSLLLDAAQALSELEQQKRFFSRDERIYSRHELIESEIDKDLAGAKADNAKQRSQIVARQGRTEIELQQIELSKADLTIRRAQKGLSALQVKAPHDGMLVLERNWRGEIVRAGSTVWPGMKLAEIPEPTQMQAQCYVLEADAGGLIAGAAATLVVESYPGRVFPAKVASVDALAKKRNEDVPVQYFEVQVLPEQTDQALMKPGQRVRAEILLEQVENALAVPRQAIVEKDGKSLVYRQKGEDFEPVEVKLGSHSLSHVVVQSGLEAGDVIALQDPTRGSGSKNSQPGQTPGGAAEAKP